MPRYQEQITYESGFYDNKVVNGQNDRVYSAENMCEPYSSMFTDGIRPDEDGSLGNGLRVSHVEGMTIQVGKGYGLFNKKYFHNRAPFKITLDDPTIVARYDCVIIRADKNEDVRDTTIYVKSLNHVPTVADLERSADGLVKEFLLAYVVVQGEDVIVSDDMIFDTRIDQEVCGLISGVFRQLDGKAIYAQWQQVFNGFMEEVKDQLAGSSTFVRYYENSYVTTLENEDIIPIGIEQFEKSIDGLIVHAGVKPLYKGADYEILDNDRIRLTLPLPVIGTRVIFEVLKSVETSEQTTIVEEVGDIQNRVSILEKSGKYDYVCNGSSDNLLISELVSAFLSKDESDSDYSTYTIHINGTFGATRPFGGDGSSANPYRWMSVGLGTSRNRRVVLDFSNCSFIRLNCEDGKYYVVFYGMDASIKNCSISATGTKSFITMFSNSTLTRIYAENCRFWLTGMDSCYIARSGTFLNCRISVTNMTLGSYAFNVGSESLLRLFGGEYYSYTANSNGKSAVVYVGGGSSTNGVAITYGINCPTLVRSGYYQTNAIECLSNNSKCSFTDTITALPINATGQNVRGTIGASKPNLM